MLNKFNFIADQSEYIKFLNWMDANISEVALMPENPTVIDVYTRMINDRDELLTLGTLRGYACL